MPTDATAGTNAAFDHDLEQLYRSWEILDLVGETAAQLPPAWLAILNVARTLLLGNPLPGVDLPGSLISMLQPDPEETIVRRVERKRRVVQPLTGDTQVQPLRDVHDLDNIAPPDLLLRNLSQQLFDYRLVSGNVAGVYNIEPGPVTEEWDEIIEERIPVQTVRQRRRQRIYVLFDVSNSMRDANKLIFAKALVLAYLVTASREGARVHFRTFANSVHDRTDCFSIDAFADVAQRILRIEPDGSTDIRVALAAAIGDINALDGVGRERDAFARSPTELLLISDCESYFVPQIPRGVSLHTVHLKAGQM
ncbi:MAG: VWA domain-containing protein, partial [Dehalococcoidia bacterium]|nr:VWA domain-containing protein [Dehalococcoidia bacterium]